MADSADKTGHKYWKRNLLGQKFWGLGHGTLAGAFEFWIFRAGFQRQPKKKLLWYFQVRRKLKNIGVINGP